MFLDENFSIFSIAFVFLIKQRCSLAALPLKTTALSLFEILDFSAAFGSPKMSVPGGCKRMFLDENFSIFSSAFVFLIKQRCSLAALPLKTTALSLFEILDFCAAFGSPKMSVSGGCKRMFLDENFSIFSSGFFFWIKQRCSLAALPLKTTALSLFETLDFFAAFGSTRCRCPGMKTCIFLTRIAQNFVIVFAIKQCCSLTPLPLKIKALRLFETLGTAC